MDIIERVAFQKDVSSDAGVRELYQRLLLWVGYLLAICSAVSLWIGIPAALVQWKTPAIAGCLLAVAAVVVCLARLRPRLGQVVLLFGPTAVLALALYWLDTPNAAFFASLIVVANGLISPVCGFASALAASAVILAFLGLGPVAISSVALVWGAAALEIIASNGYQTALAWAWQSQKQSSELLEQLRDRQGELNRTLESLTEANRRLQHTGYELAVARLRADAAREAKEQFVANVSHELRTPLSVVEGFAEMMYLNPDVYGNVNWTPVLRQDVRRIYYSSKQLADLVSDVLALAHADSSEMLVSREESDLREVVQSAVATVQGQHSLAHIPIHVDIRPEVPPLSIDGVRIRQVLINLLNNALRFTESGSINVSAIKRTSDVTVSVRDTGVGIPSEELPRVFDAFHQVDMSLRHPQGGTGLGLAISKRFVNLHGGEIRAESTLGQGTTISFTLPLSDTLRGDPSLVITQPNRPPRRDASTPIVLLVRDPTLQTFLPGTLDGYHFIAASNVGEAVQCIAEHNAQLVLADCSLGDRPVLSSIEELMDRTSDTVSVLACSLPSLEALALGSLPISTLAKPVKRADLQALLQQHGHPYHILLVDQDRDFPRMLARFIDSFGEPHQIAWAHSADEWLAQMHTQPPDLVIVNIQVLASSDAPMVDELRRANESARTRIVVLSDDDQAESTLAPRSGMVAVVARQGYTVAKAFRLLSTWLDAGLGPATDGS